jgi:two-component system NtrC family sensor kinase
LPSISARPLRPRKRSATSCGSFGKETEADELDCKACGYATCREHAIAIYRGLAETQMCLPYVIERFDQTVRQLSDSNRQLESTQEQLMHSERLASMGQLAAGVAHELNNPLGVVLLYATFCATRPARTQGFARS